MTIDIKTPDTRFLPRITQIQPLGDKVIIYLNDRECPIVAEITYKSLGNFMLKNEIKLDDGTLKGECFAVVREQQMSDEEWKSIINLLDDIKEIYPEWPDQVKERDKLPYIVRQGFTPNIIYLEPMLDFIPVVSKSDEKNNDEEQELQDNGWFYGVMKIKNNIFRIYIHPEKNRMNIQKNNVHPDFI